MGCSIRVSRVRGTFACWGQKLEVGPGVRRCHRDGMDKRALSASPTVDKGFISLVDTGSLRGKVKVTVAMLRD